MKSILIGAAASSFVFFTAGCSGSATAPDPTASSTDALRADHGNVYVLSNDAANAVLVYDRARDGSLTLAASVPTGGAGSGDGLGSQGALTLSRDGHWLFAVNAGNHSVSALRVHRDGSLVLVDVADSGGDRPVSVAESWGVVYALNAGERQNVSGFYFDGAHLRAIPRATQPLSRASAVGAAQVAFDPDGDALVVTEKGTSSIDVFRLGRDGAPGAGHVFASSGATPFGFAVDESGTVVVSDAFGGAAGAGAASSYRLRGDASLELVSAAVGNRQGAPCWVAIDRGYAYVTNTASGTVSSYRIGSGGSLALVGAAAGSTGDKSGPADEAVAGGFLFVRNGGSGAISAFRIAGGGTLTAAGTFGALPPHAYGLAAR